MSKNEPIGTQHRQGDIFFEKIADDAIPEGAKVDKRGVFAEGEVSGHLHQINPGEKALMMVMGDEMFCNTNGAEETHVIHPEHNTVTLGGGNWVVTRQVEYTPKGWSRVAD